MQVPINTPLPPTSPLQHTNITPPRSSVPSPPLAPPAPASQLPPVGQGRPGGATSPSVGQQRQRGDFKTLPARNGAASPLLSPSPAMLQEQLARLQTRNVPVRNQVVVETPRPSLDRRNSYSDNIKSRLVSKAKTPTFGELQSRFGSNRHSPSPLSDRDYQKEARQTVVGELSG